MCVSVFNTYLALSSVFVNVNFRKVSWLVPFQTFFFFPLCHHCASAIIKFAEGNATAARREREVGGGNG